MCATKAVEPVTSRNPDREQRSPDQVGGGDLAVVVALLDPDAVFVRERGGEATSLMRREADGSWYFVD
jgi:hypothetical protein